MLEAMIRTETLKACRMGGAAWWKQRRIEDSVNKSVSKAFRLVTTVSSWKQQKTESGVDSALLYPAHSMCFDLFPLRTMSTTVYSPDDSHVRWRFPVDDRTRDMFMKIHHGVLSQIMIVTLNAASPITQELMEEALNILYDKVESLRICFRLRQNTLWVADMPNRLMDFKSVSGDDLWKHIFHLSSSSFDIHNGPLWKVRLMTSPPDSPCHFPKVKEKFPYQHKLLLSLHHAANDGRALMLLTESLFRILDHLLQGLHVDGQQIGILRDGIEAREEEHRIKTALENDPVRLKAALRELELTNHVPLLVEAFGAVSETSPRTNLLPPIQFDAEVMKSIDHKCRSFGVSTNAFMTAVFNTALVEVVREAGLKRSNYLISSIHPVDSRRLMGKTSKPVLGYHTQRMVQSTVTPHDVKGRFWGYLKDLNAELRGKLKRNYMCEQRVLHAMLRSEGYNQEMQYAHPLPLSHDYMLSNIHSPFAFPGGTGTLAHITSMSMYVKIHKEIFPLGLGFFDVRGKTFLELTHSTATISKKVAHRLHDKIVVVLHDISRAMT
ncbi:uncharacterized protein LOC135095089 isoform X1 [Scylla paramamosain]|uniref:uncharacterized protein LOC135095089 isoform X1 n=2 Tax=Scylla paramamosain TaxID=85552 RepID=UPI003083E72D